MSNKVVRDAVKAAWAALLPTIPLIPTENVEPKGMTSPWAALEFSSYNEERDSLGASACYLEEGEVNVFLYVDAGVGNSGLIDEAEKVVAAFRSWEDITGAVKVVRLTPIEEFPESSGLWYGATIGISYEYRFFI